MNEERQNESIGEEVVPTEIIETTEAAPLSPEQAAEAIDQRVEAFGDGVIDPVSRATELGITGEDAEKLAASYAAIAERLKSALGNAGATAKKTIMAAAIGSMVAVAPEAYAESDQALSEAEAEIATLGQPAAEASQEPEPVNELFAYNQDPNATNNEEQPEEPLLRMSTELSSEVLAEKGAIEEVSTPDQEAGPLQLKMSPELARTVEEIRQAVRDSADNEVLQDFAMLRGPQDLGKFLEKHGALLAGKFVPGAGIKHALQGTDEYNVKLSTLERWKSALDGVMDIATFGGSNAARVASGVYHARESLADFVEDTTVSNGANFIGDIAHATGAGAIKNAAEVVQLATDPIVRKAAGIVTPPRPTPPSTTTNNTETVFPGAVE